MERKRAGINVSEKSGNSRFFYGRFSVHPLFLAVGVASCLLGELPVFLLSTVVALLHELAHAYAAERVGLRMKKVVLMPYGAMIDIDMRGLNAVDELKIALAGPFFNLLCAALFLGLWWCFPATYPYTESAQISSLAVGLINLLPAYPLDGGRILRLWLIRAFTPYLPPAKCEKRAEIITSFVSVFTAFSLLAFFVYALFNGVFSLSLLLFALFVLLGVPKGKSCERAYERIDFRSCGKLKRGMVVRRVAVDDSCTLKKALGFFSQGEYLLLDIFDENGEPLGTLTQNRLSEAILQENLYEKAVKLLAKTQKS